jgi:pimeloyl-ACP methyl ester carboxylesterase
VALTLELADGGRVGYEIYGDEAGTPLVLLHGLSDSRLTGAAFAAAAARTGTRLLVPDRPGIGLSTGRLGSFAGFAAWLDGVADALGLERFPLAAISGGGPFALAAAYHLPERVRRVTVVSGLGPPELGVAGMPRGERFGIAVARRAPGLGAAVMGAVAAFARRRPDLFLALVRLNTGGVDARALGEPGSVDTMVRPFVEAYRQGTAGIRGELALVLRPWSFRPEEIRVPVRLEHGAEDATVPPAAARALAERIPGAVLSIRPGVGHFSLAPRYGDEILRAATVNP